MHPCDTNFLPARLCPRVHLHDLGCCLGQIKLIQELKSAWSNHPHTMGERLIGSRQNFGFYTNRVAPWAQQSVVESHAPTTVEGIRVIGKSGSHICPIRTTGNGTGWLSIN